MLVIGQRLYSLVQFNIQDELLTKRVHLEAGLGHVVPLSIKKNQKRCTIISIALSAEKAFTKQLTIYILYMNFKERKTF